MSTKRQKHEFKVTGCGKSATVVAHTRGAAVHQFRRLCQPQDGTRQFQMHSIRSEGWWDDVQIELLNPPAKQVRAVFCQPPTFVPSIASGKPEQPRAAGLHPDTSKPTPRWEWTFHSCGPNGNKKPICYYRKKEAA